MDYCTARKSRSAQFILIWEPLPLSLHQLGLWIYTHHHLVSSALVKICRWKAYSPNTLQEAKSMADQPLLNDKCKDLKSTVVSLKQSHKRTLHEIRIEWSNRIAGSQGMGGEIWLAHPD